MAAELGWVGLGVAPDFTGFQGKVETGASKAMAAAGVKGGTDFGEAAGRSAGSRFGSVFKSAAKAGLVGLAGVAAGAVKLSMDSISAASDLEESTNKVSQVFGTAADRVFRFSERTADALGQTNQQARDAAATFGLFGNIAGLTDRRSAKFSTRMTRLASDLASFHNTEPSQAVEALGAALRGESEPIRSFGVLLDEATLKAEAMSLGLLKPVKDQAKIQSYQVAIMEGQKKYNDAVEEFGSKSLEALKAEANLGTARDRLKKATEGTIPALTQQQKVLAAQSSIFKQTEVAQGDFARTSDELANQQRRLSARFEDAKAKLGVGLLPIMTKAADFLLDKGIPAFEDFSVWFNDEGIPAIKEFGDFAKGAAGKVKALVGFVKDMPDPAKFAGLVAVLGGVGALKLRGGSGGALGTAGKALGIAKPVPVFVTNPGALGLGSGPDVDGKTGSKLGRVASKAGLIAAPYAVGYEVQKNFPEFAPFGDKGFLPGSGTGEGKGWMSWFEDDKPKKAEEAVITLTGKVNGLNDALFLAGNKKIRPVMDDREIVLANERLGQFISKMVDAGKPVTPYINTSSIERALELMAQLPAAAHGVPTAGTDGGAPFLSGGAQRAGVTFTGPIHVQPKDYDDFNKKMQRKSQQANLGGRPVD